ncbi:MAG: Two component system histidine kinase [Anaerosporomusa subterranea]|jgi:signal transduction histidine kinase|nr:Two component system histidine kinase [Anaerosporomusa subterranea]
MSFFKQVSIFVAVLIVLPMALFFHISTLAMSDQITRSEQKYLQNALLIARSSMLGRKTEMQQGGQYLSVTPEFREALKSKDSGRLTGLVDSLRGIYQYLDFVVILDDESKVIASYPKKVNASGKFDINGLVRIAQKTKQGIFSEEVFNLTLLFAPDSEPYQRFRVKLTGSESLGTESYLTKCQAGVVVSPVYDQGSPLGFIVMGDISNNDQFFPETYSRQVKDSFLAISVDDTRVTSNISTPKNTDYIGSRTPIEMSSLEGERFFYFGKVNIDGEVHVFVDEPIIDFEGKIIGVLGVGIPEERFSRILSTNHNLIFIVTVISLCVMLIVAKYVAAHITKPILLAISMAEKIRRGERELNLRPEWLRDTGNETTVLLVTFQQMANELAQGEEKRKNYVMQLKEEHRRQQQMAKELQLMNQELEEKVTARTQDLQQAFGALKKADEVKSQFLANMSHELRTPLNSIICSADIIKEKLFGPLSEKQERYVQTIWSSGTHLLQLINDILDICKIEAGKMQLSLSQFVITDVVDNCFNVVKSLAYRKNIDVVIVIDPPCFVVSADAKKLRQILYNLLSNAIKFTPEGGRVDLEVIRRDPVVRFSVRDNGIGIREEDRDRVFREFEQVDSSYARQHEGTGLGLSLTKKLVEMHGGEIYLTSKLGLGTEVMFTIPIDTESYLNRESAS